MAISFRITCPLPYKILCLYGNLDQNSLSSAIQDYILVWQYRSEFLVHCHTRFHACMAISFRITCPLPYKFLCLYGNLVQNSLPTAIQDSMLEWQSRSEFLVHCHTRFYACMAISFRITCPLPYSILCLNGNLVQSSLSTAIRDYMLVWQSRS